MDVCITKDNQVVVIHDSKLKRLTGVEGKVRDFDYKDLPRIGDKVPVHFDFSTFDASKCSDRKIALFDEVWEVLGKQDRTQSI